MTKTIFLTSREVLEAADPDHAVHTAIEHNALTGSSVIRCSCGADVVATHGTAKKLGISFLEMQRLLTARVPITPTKV